MGAPEKLSAAQRSKIRRLAQPKEVPADEEAGELNIVPFLDIIMNVLMFVLATISVTFTATIQTNPPKSSGRASAKDNTPTLGLNVIIVANGFSLKSSGGNVAPGCAEVGPGLAVPKKGDKYDYVALKSCAQALKGLRPEYQDERAVTIAANPNIPYDVVINVMDAVRTPVQPKDEKDLLFPEVNFGVPR
jgi:biopolymer transport protein TolR